MASAKFKCDTCDNVYGLEICLIRHKDVYLENHQCIFCSKSFESSTRLSQHYREHTKEKPYECDLWDKSFASPTSLRSHNNSHTGDKSFPCNICKKSFSNSSTLKHISWYIVESKTLNAAAVKKRLYRKLPLRHT